MVPAEDLYCAFTALPTPTARATALSAGIVTFPVSQRSLFQSAVKIGSRHEIRWEFYDLCLMLGNSINFYEVLWANA